MTTLNFFLRITVYTIIYIISFAVTRIYFDGAIVFYQGNLLIIANLFLFAIFDAVRYKTFTVLVTNLPSYFTALILSFSILSTFPVILDRSITLHMYKFLSINEGATVDAIRNDFIFQFVYENKGIEKRINEQIVLGNIEVRNGLIYLTDKGMSSQVFFEFLNRFFNIRPTYKNVTY